MVRHRKYITLDELVREVMPLLLPYVENTIVEIPAFMDVADDLLSFGTGLPKNICWNEVLNLPMDQSSKGSNPNS
jgi:hypothetical protein